MKTNSLKSAYRFGGTIFIVSVLIMSLIFGLFFRSCSKSDNVVNVNLPENRNPQKDTIFIERSVEKIVRDTVRIPVIQKVYPVIQKKDTSSKK